MPVRGHPHQQLFQRKGSDNQRTQTAPVSSAPRPGTAPAVRDLLRRARVVSTYVSLFLAKIHVEMGKRLSFLFAIQFAGCQVASGMGK